MNWDKQFIHENIFENIDDFPLLDERVKILHDVSNTILNRFNG